MSKLEYNREWRRRRRQRERAEFGSFKVGHVVYGRPPQADIEARLAEIPRDTRSVTALLMGDPIPGDPRRQARVIGR